MNGDWRTEMQEKAWDCVSDIAEVYDNYEYKEEEVYNKTLELLKEYGFID